MGSATTSALRPLAPLWARAVLAAAVGSLAIPSPAQQQPWSPAIAGASSATDLLDAGVVAAVLVALAAVMALGWPDLRLRRVAAIGAAVLAGAALSLRPEYEPIEAPLWPALLAGGAVAALRRTGDAAGATLRRRAAHALCGAAVTAVAVVGAHVIFAEASAPLSVDVAVRARPMLLAMALVVAAEVGARLSRKTVPRRSAVLLLAGLYALVGHERGGFWTSIEERLDTGDRRTYYLGVPFVALSYETAPEPERTELLELARHSEILRPIWRTRATFSPEAHAFYSRDRAFAEDRLRVWLDRDARIALRAREDLAEWIEDGCGASPPECMELVGRERALAQPWTQDEVVRDYCRRRGLDLRDGVPTLAIAIADDEAGLRAQVEAGVRFEKIGAARRLVERFPAVAGEVVPGLLRDDDRAVRQAAARALADLGDPAVLPRLRDALQLRRAEYATSRELLVFEDAVARLEAKAGERR